MLGVFSPLVDVCGDRFCRLAQKNGRDRRRSSVKTPLSALELDDHPLPKAAWTDADPRNGARLNPSSPKQRGTVNEETVTENERCAVRQQPRPHPQVETEQRKTHEREDSGVPRVTLEGKVDCSPNSHGKSESDRRGQKQPPLGERVPKGREVPADHRMSS